jgi:hypothetical protein
MTTDEQPDWSLIDFARNLAGMPQTEPVPGFNFAVPARDTGALAAAPKSTNEDSAISSNPHKDQDAETADVKYAHATQIAAPSTSGKKQLKAPAEIAQIIMTALRSIDKCPERGFTVTVYGSNPWNAMLTIRPEAGSSIDFPLWLARVQEIGVRLREDFDILYVQP